MSILVTGGLGFIGSHTIIELVENDYSIVIIDDLSNSNYNMKKRLQDYLKCKLTVYCIDLSKTSLELESIFRNHNISCVIHFAGLKSVSESVNDPLQYYETNINSTINLIRIMKKYDCKQFIFSSSATVYGDSDSPLEESGIIGRNLTNPYGKTKYIIEDMLKDFHMANSDWRIIILRYFNPIGAHKSGLFGEDPNGIPNNIMPYITRVALQNNIEDIEKKSEYNELKIFGDNYDTPDGTCIRDYVHVVDLAKGHLSAMSKIMELKNNYEVVNLGTGKGTSVFELVNMFKEENNVILPYSVIERREGDLSNVYCDTTKAKKLFGWEAELTIKDMVKDAYEFQKIVIKK